MYSRSNRQFYLSNERLNYVMRLLSHDMDYETHQMLIEEEELETAYAVCLSRKITECLNTLNIYEYSVSDTQVIPVINPSNAALNDGFKLNPISNESTQFLTQLSRFLLTVEPILIN